MPWSADVPFPAEDIGKCRGCDAPIGWLEVDKKDGTRSRTPVEVKGWAGVPVDHATKSMAYKRGYTHGGKLQAILDPESVFGLMGDHVVIFETHFAFCPKRKVFERAKRIRKLRDS